jgi:hypothetical protein
MQPLKTNYNDTVDLNNNVPTTLPIQNGSGSSSSPKYPTHQPTPSAPPLASMTSGGSSGGSSGGGSFRQRNPILDDYPPLTDDSEVDNLFSVCPFSLFVFVISVLC